MRKQLLLVCLVLLIIVSCQKETVYPNSIIGKWDWTKSSGGIGGWIYTPQITGEKIMVEFTADSIFRNYRNDSLIIESKFSISKTETIFSGDSVDLIIYGNDFRRQSFLLESPMELILLDEFCDGFVSHYKRIK